MDGGRRVVDGGIKRASEVVDEGIERAKKAAETLEEHIEAAILRAREHGKFSYSQVSDEVADFYRIDPLRRPSHTMAGQSTYPERLSFHRNQNRLSTIDVPSFQRISKYLVTRHWIFHHPINRLLFLSCLNQFLALHQHRHTHCLRILFRSLQMSRLQHNVSHNEFHHGPNPSRTICLRRLYRHISADCSQYYDNTMGSFLLRARKSLDLYDPYRSPRCRRRNPTVASNF